MSSLRESKKAKLGVLDFGGQFTHLLAAQVRKLGAYCEILSPSKLSASQAQAEYAGLILSGGPASVYAPSAPRCDSGLFSLGIPILGICYGHQLLMQASGGIVSASPRHEYGPALLSIKESKEIFAKEDRTKKSVVWMSHGDEVKVLPPGFQALAATQDCPYAAVGDSRRKLFGVQFHPEVEESERGSFYLKNFITLCGAADTWRLKDFLLQQEEALRARFQKKKAKVFFLLSGGVDSTVAFVLLARVLPASHLIALHIDTGFMRKGEAAEVEKALSSFGISLKIINAAKDFYSALEGICDPEQKRRVIGEVFLDVQKKACASLGLKASEWLLGQGTIYPDQIESGAGEHSCSIKTHHNRAPVIQALLEQSRVVEPIAELYKDEVRELGRLLNIDKELLQRHPFPGPGLAVRCLCADSKFSTSHLGIQEELTKELAGAGLDAGILPIRSVGVQGDKRSYRSCLALFYKDLFPDWSLLLQKASSILNRFHDFNRVVLHIAPQKEALTFMRKEEAYLTKERISFLQDADSLVRSFLSEHDLYDKIWQFPVALLPVFAAMDSSKSKEALLLRPVLSKDAMTASVYCMPPELLMKLHHTLVSALEGASAVFYDLTSKPPGTIEWE